MSGPGQQALFELPVEERHLRDDERTVLEAIDKLGQVTARKAGEIVYTLARRRRPANPAWYRSAGFAVLDRLHERGLVARSGATFTRPERSATA